MVRCPKGTRKNKKGDCIEIKDFQIKANTKKQQKYQELIKDKPVKEKKKNLVEFDNSSSSLSQPNNDLSITPPLLEPNPISPLLEPSLSNIIQKSINNTADNLLLEQQPPQQPAAISSPPPEQPAAISSPPPQQPADIIQQPQPQQPAAISSQVVYDLEGEYNAENIDDNVGVVDAVAENVDDNVIVDDDVIKLTKEEEDVFAKNKRLYMLRQEKHEYDDEGDDDNVKGLGLYPFLNDSQFQEKIALKQEFFDTQYDPTVYSVEKQADVLCHASFELNPHQLFIKKFLSTNTPYNSLLLFHGLGTGKTITAVGVAEEMRQYMKKVGQVKPIMVVANTNVRDNFKKELMQTDKYDNPLLQEIRQKTTTTNTTKATAEMLQPLVRKYYSFYGYRKLAIEIYDIIKLDGSITPRVIKLIREKFNDTLLIIDEVHNIRGDTKKSSTEDEKPNGEKINTKIGEKISELLMIVATYAVNMRLLLLSATPVFNSYKEIIWLTNLMNVNDKRPKIILTEIFDKKGFFRPAETLKNGVVIESGRDLLKRKLTGYVSFIRGENPYSFPYRLYPNTFAPDKTFSTHNHTSNTIYPTVLFNGRPITQPIQYIQLYCNTIHPEQEKVYRCILQQKQKTPRITD